MKLRFRIEWIIQCTPIKDNIVGINLIPANKEACALVDVCREEDEVESSSYDNCQNCGKEFDEISYEYQICSSCGYDSDEGCFNPMYKFI